MNLPNALTITRIFLVPLLVVVLLTKFEGHAVLGLPTPLIGAAIFGLASFTDWLDGYLARRRGQVTSLGRMMDPIADKLLTSAAFISLVQLGLAPAWIVAVIIGRELAVTGLRSLASARGVGFGASALGKVKMASQVTTILLLILGQNGAQPFLWLGQIGALGGAADGAGVGGGVLPQLPGRAGWPGVDLRLRRPRGSAAVARASAYFFGAAGSALAFAACGDLVAGVASGFAFERRLQFIHAHLRLLQELALLELRDELLVERQRFRVQAEFHQRLGQVVVHPVPRREAGVRLQQSLQAIDRAGVPALLEVEDADLVLVQAQAVLCLAQLLLAVRHQGAVRVPFDEGLELLDGGLALRLVALR